MGKLLNKIERFCLDQELSTLYLEVHTWLEDKDLEDDEIMLTLSDLVSHGCSSGMVSSLIYYDDTAIFFKNHKTAINELLVGAGLTPAGLTPAGLTNYDLTDPLCLETNNQSLLAWFGFEYVATDIFINLEGDQNEDI